MSSFDPFKGVVFLTPGLTFQKGRITTDGTVSAFWASSV